MKLSKHAKFWALGALGGVGLFALGVFAQQTLEINPSEQDLFSDLKAVFFLDRNGDEIKSIVRWNASGSTLVTAPTSELTGGEAKNTLQNNASIIGSTDSSNTSAGAFLIATNGGKVQGESMQSFIGGANNTTLSGFNTIAVATKDTNINADNALALASKNTNITAKDAIAIGGEDIKLKGQASLAIGSKIDSAAQGAMVFNAKNERLNLNNESNNTFVINAGNGLIVNANTSANPKIQLTVSGAIKLGEVNNAPAEASPYISTKKVGNVTCICGKVNNGNIAISKYSRNNKQHAEICQKVCNNETPTLPGQCGAAATNYPLGQTQWSTDDFCQGGIGYAGAKPTFPALGGQTIWTCESFPSGGVNCTATRKGCGDGIRAAGEQCDLGTNNGKPDSNCSASCENVKDPKCGANAKTYLGSDVAWAQPNGFCADDSVLSGSIPNFRSNCNKCGLRGFPYCFDVSFDANSAVCKSSSQSDIAGTKTWTCKNKNGKNLTCTTTKQPPMVAGKCNLTQLGECDAGVLSGAIKTINNGKRWECSGLYGGSNNTCSTCNNGYTYNETSTECEATTCPSGYSLNNGKCVQWRCVEKYWTRTPSKCIGTSTNPKQDCASLSSTISFFDDGHRCKKQAGCTRVPQSEKTTVAEEAKCFGTGGRIDASNCSSLPEPSCPASCADPLFKVPLEGATVRGVSRTIRASNCAIGGQLYNFEGTTYYVAKDSQDLKEKIKSEHGISRRVVTTRVTDMRGLFRNYTFSIREEDLIHWDTSNVTNMSSMFYGARDADPEINYRDIRKVKSMIGMFALAKSFNHSLDNWDISKIQSENLTNMFYSATTFKNNQPYCKWEKWSSKRENFEDMELNACTSKINGQCKTYSGLHESQPATATANGCLAGDYEDITTDGFNSWKWKCKGKNGGTSAECSVAKPAPIDGQCKVYPGGAVYAYTSQPATNTANGCIAGDYEDHSDPESIDVWLWTCKGKYGGVGDVCSANRMRGRYKSPNRD